MLQLKEAVELTKGGIINFFGEIIDDEMKLSNIGVIADILWYEIKNHAKNVELGAFVVMPNHIHGILILHNDINDVGNITDVADVAVETLHATSLLSKISPKSNSVSTIIRSYKSAVTKHAHRLGYDFAWQSRFYDHIIRDEKSYDRISNYIVNNPAKWDNDKFYKNDNNSVMEPPTNYGDFNDYDYVF